MAIAFLLFFVVSISIGIGILWFYSGNRSDEIKVLLKDSFTKITGIFGNLKQLFIIIQSLVESQPEAKEESTDIKIENGDTDKDSSSSQSNAPVAVVENEPTAINDLKDNDNANQPMTEEIKVGTNESVIDVSKDSSGNINS